MFWRERMEPVERLVSGRRAAIEDKRDRGQERNAVPAWRRLPPTDTRAFPRYGVVGDGRSTFTEARGKTITDPLGRIIRISAGARDPAALDAWASHRLTALWMEDRDR